MQSDIKDLLILSEIKYKQEFNRELPFKWNDISNVEIKLEILYQALSSKKIIEEIPLFVEYISEDIKK